MNVQTDLRAGCECGCDCCGNTRIEDNSNHDNTQTNEGIGNVNINDTYVDGDVEVEL